jgi:hypothetical protein
VLMAEKLEGKRKRRGWGSEPGHWRGRRRRGTGRRGARPPQPPVSRDRTGTGERKWR